MQMKIDGWLKLICKAMNQHSFWNKSVQKKQKEKAQKNKVYSHSALW